MLLAIRQKLKIRLADAADDRCFSTAERPAFLAIGPPGRGGQEVSCPSLISDLFPPRQKSLFATACKHMKSAPAQETFRRPADFRKIPPVRIVKIVPRIPVLLRGIASC
jgi:hypothetical protein